MTIYGLGILAACFLAGQLLGEMLGRLIGIDANVGGVGFAMILLILANDKLIRKNLLPPATQQGILFWSAMYIPVIVAMSATQNVVGRIFGRVYGCSSRYHSNRRHVFPYSRSDTHP